MWGRWKLRRVRHGYRHQYNLWVAEKGVILGTRPLEALGGEIRLSDSKQLQIGNCHCWIRNALELHNLIAKGVANQAGQGMSAELAHDVVPVGFYCVNTEPQGCRDLLVTLLLGQ